MTTISFTGDIAFSGYFSGKYQPEILDERIIGFLTDSDYTVANVEGPVTDHTDDKTFHHSNPTAVVPFLRAINANIWNLGNNHTFDFGVKGIEDTISIAGQNDIPTIGAGRADRIIEPLILGDNELALVSVTYSDNKRTQDGVAYGTLHWQDKALPRIIADAKRRCRWCVVIAHCGDEFTPLPMPYVRKTYRRFLEYGADLVIGHHPHVVQNYETVGDKLIVYSLGNFVFDTDYQRCQNHTELGMLVKFRFSSSYFQWESMPVRIDREASMIRPCDPIDVFTDLSEQQYRKYWPLAARRLEINQKKARVHLGTFRSPARDYIKRFTHLRHPYGRDIFIGDILEKTTRYDENSSLYQYISQS